MKLTQELYAVKEFIFILILAVFISFGIYFLLPEEYKIEQNVYPISEFERRIEFDKFDSNISNLNYNNSNSYYDNLRYDSNAKAPEILHPENPFKYGNIIYRLESSYRDSTYTDYGNKDKIISIKCKRYQQLLKIKKFESSKQRIIFKEIDEINKIKCK